MFCTSTLVRQWLMLKGKKMSAQKKTDSSEGKFKYILGAILFIGGGLFTTILQVTELYHRLDPIGISPFKLTPPGWWHWIGSRCGDGNCPVAVRADAVRGGR